MANEVMYHKLDEKVYSPTLLRSFSKIIIIPEVVFGVCIQLFLYLHSRFLG